MKYLQKKAIFRFWNSQSELILNFLLNSIQDVQLCSFFRQPEPMSYFNPLEPELKAVQSRLEAMETELGDSQQRLAHCLTANAELKDEIERVKKDQEDLLVLLADQDGKVLKYKDRLKNLGQTVICFKSIQNEIFYSFEVISGQ